MTNRRPARRSGRRGRVPIDPARMVAFEALRAVHADDAYANLIVPQLVDRAGLVGRDAALVTELVAGTCRLQGTYDAIIAAASGRKINSFQPAVLDILRLGSHQLLTTRIPAHAAVAATVDLAADTVGERVRGLTNAILRKISAHSWSEWLTELDADGLGRSSLVLRTAHPAWIVDAFADVLPADELEPALLADNINPLTTLVVRPGLCTIEELRAAGAGPGNLSPYAATWQGNPRELAAVRDGRAGVQDEGSQLVAIGLTRALAPQGPWLDLCAGPGGKSALLQGLAQGRGSLLLASELQPHRAGLVAAGLRGYSSSAVIVADGTVPAWRPGSFARVLADVPCSGLGALRRRPESRWRRQPEVVEELHSLQVELLQSALAAALPGGIVAYVTCSPHQRETSDVVTEVLASRADVSIVPAADLLPELDDAFAGDYLQLWPHRHRTDAMFAAYLRVGD